MPGASRSSSPAMRVCRRFQLNGVTCLTKLDPNSMLRDWLCKKSCDPAPGVQKFIAPIVRFLCGLVRREATHSEITFIWIQKLQLISFVGCNCDDTGLVGCATLLKFMRKIAEKDKTQSRNFVNFCNSSSFVANFEL